MNENEYRALYNSLNQQRCPYEKALLTRKHNCNNLIRYNIAEREAVGCNNTTDWQRCQFLLNLLRSKAQFAIQSSSQTKALGHAKEIRIQSGGLIGLKNTLSDTNPDEIINITLLLDDIITEYNDFQNIPFTEVMKSVASFQGRKRRQDK